MTELLTLDDLSKVFPLYPESKSANCIWYKEFILDGIPFWVRENKTHFECSISGFPELTRIPVCLGFINISRKISLDKVKKEVKNRLITDTVK